MEYTRAHAVFPLGRAVEQSQDRRARDCKIVPPLRLSGQASVRDDDDDDSSAERVLFLSLSPVSWCVRPLPCHAVRADTSDGSAMMIARPPTLRRRATTASKGSHPPLSARAFVHIALDQHALRPPSPAQPAHATQGAAPASAEASLALALPRRSPALGRLAATLLGRLHLRPACVA